MIVRLVAAREISSRLQQKSFRLGLLATLVIIAVVCVVPSFFSDGDKATYDVGVSSQLPASFGPALTEAGRVQGVTLTAHRAPPAAVEQEVRKGTWPAGFVGTARLLVHSGGDAVVGVLREAYPTATLLAERPADTGSIDRLAVVSTQPPDSDQRDQRRAIASVTVIVLFLQLITFCSWVAMGVVEEKSSRVVELVLSAVRPMQLLAGKLLGIGILATVQMLLVGVVALVAATSAGTISIPVTAWSVLVVSFVSFVLTFGFFAAVSAALGATVSRQEEVSGAIMPVSLLMTVSYFASFVVAGNSGTTLARVLSIIPPVSGLAMPARIAGGGVPALDIVLAAALMVVAAVAAVVVGARIYRASVLHSGTRVRLRTAWRGEAVGG